MEKRALYRMRRFLVGLMMPRKPPFKTYIPNIARLSRLSRATMESLSSSAPQAHVASALIFPHPTPSHIVPAILLAIKLAAKGLPITFVMTEYDKYHMGAQLANHARIRCLGVPDGLGPGERRSVRNPRFMQALGDLRGEIEKVIQILETQEGSTPCCIISDIFSSWMQDVALKFNIPRVLFWTGGACSFSIFLHIPLLLARGILPLKGKFHPNEPDTMIDFIPGLPPLQLSDLPAVISVQNTSDQFFQYIFRSFQKVGKFPRVLVHSFEELQREILDALVPIASLYPVGPLVQTASLDRSITEEDSCLRWLDKHAVSSVLYIAFGTAHLLSIPLVQTLAIGLEASNQPFLWSIRYNAMGVASLSEILPEGFLSRIKDRGLIVSWAPQMSVLSHPSVGGFLTHCGWNSTMESICAGVPMIAWPQGAEQAINARFIVEEWKIGVRLRVGADDGCVDSGDVEAAVKWLMQRDEDCNNSMRKRVKELAEAGRRAMSEGGSSDRWLRKFVDDMVVAEQVP